MRNRCGKENTQTLNLRWSGSQYIFYIRQGVHHSIFSEAVSCEAISGSRNNHKEITRALDFTDVGLGNPKCYLSLGGPKKI